MQTPTRFLIVASLAMLFGVTVAHATDPGILPTLDQDYIIAPVTIGYAISRGQSLAQTFTVGRSGNLHRLDLQVCKNRSEPIASLIVDLLRTLPDGSPDYGTILASIEVDSSKVTEVPFTVQVTSIDLEGVPVGTGDRLAISLSADTSVGSGRYFWATHETLTPESYLEGDLFSVGLETVIGQRNRAPADAGFRTYVDVVPEPTTFTLAATSVALIAAVWRITGNSPARRLRHPQG